MEAIIAVVSFAVDAIYEAVPLLAVGLLLILCWMMFRFWLKLLMKSAKLIAFAVLLYTLNTVLERDKSLEHLKDADWQRYAVETVQDWDLEEHVLSFRSTIQSVVLSAVELVGSRRSE